MPSSATLPLPVLRRWGQVPVRRITSYCSVPSWQPYPSSRSYGPPNSLTLAHSLLFQWSDQTHLGVLPIHLGRSHRQYIRSRRISPLDRSDQQGGGRQFVDSSTCQGSPWHRGDEWDWLVPFLGGVRLPGDEHYSLYDQVRAF